MSTTTDDVTIERPATEIGNLNLGGNAFAAALEKAGAIATDTAPPEPKKDDAPPPAKTDDTAPPPKKDDAPPPPPAKDKAKGKTPLDVAPPAAKQDDATAAADPEIAELLKSEPPANASASSKANHAAMRKGLERANSRIQALAAELNEAKGKTGTVPPDVEERIKTATQRAEQLQAELERVAFERSPRYQKFVTESEAELASAKGYLEGSDVNPTVVDLAAKATGAGRLKILKESGMDSDTVSAVLSHLTRSDAINREREAAQATWKETNASWTAEQQKQSELRAAQVKAQEDKVFADVGKKMSETLAPFQTTGGENPEWDAQVAERNALAQEFFDGKKPLPETAALIYEGLAGRVYKDAFEDLRTKYNDLVSEHQRVVAARPGAAGGKVDADTVAGPKTIKDPMKAVEETFAANQRRILGG